MIIEKLNKLQKPLCDAWSLGGSIGGALIGAAGAAITNKQNQEYQRELMGLQHGYNEKAAENAYQRQRELNAENWKLYNSYEAQRASMEAAGLSPALMYGMGGAGGSGAGNTAPQGNGTGLPQANMQNTGAAAVQGLEAGLIAAQIRKTDAEARAIDEKTPAEVADTWASVGQRNANIRYQLSQERLTELLSRNQEIKNAFQGQHELYELNEEFISNLRQTIAYQREGLLLQFDTETYNEKVTQYKEQTKNIMAQTALLGANKELTEANKQLVQKELDAFDTKLQNQIMTAVSAYNKGQAARINATAAVVELNNNLKIKGIQLEQKNLELYIEASKVSGAAQLGLGAGAGGKGGLHGNANLYGSGSGNRARKDAKDNYFNGSGYTIEFMPEIDVDWKEVYK